MKTIIIHHSRFLPKAHGHGGERRTAQVINLIRKSGHEILELDVKIRRSDLKLFELDKDSQNIRILELFLSVCSACILLVKSGWIWKFRNIGNLISSVKSIAVLKIRIRQLIPDNYCKAIFVWESTTSHYFYLPLLFRNHNAIVIGIPQNLESLVNGQFSAISKRKSPYYFNEELKYLSCCDTIFAISREEEWLLRLNNLNAWHLPYYPSKDIENELLRIRKLRTEKLSNNCRKQILMIGTANNPPTRAGLINRINYFKNIKNDLTINIVGFGTDAFANEVAGKNGIILHGSVSQEKLSNFYINTDIALIHQCATTGMLTRIIELLICGIPVVINSESARSYWGYNGIYVYESDNQLERMLEKFDFDMPELPKKSESLISIFQSNLR